VTRSALPAFNLDRVIELACNPFEIDHSIEAGADWDRFCQLVNTCEDAAWLARVFEQLAERIAHSTGGIRLQLVLDDLPQLFLVARLQQIVWEALFLLAALTGERPDVPTIVRGTLTLADLLNGPRIPRRWWRLMKTGAAVTGGGSKGGKAKSKASFGATYQAELDKLFRRDSNGFKLTVARKKVAHQFDISATTVAKYTTDPRRGIATG
jgi:hypothetical protein